MCARYAFFTGRIPVDLVGEVPLPDLAPRYNIAPSSVVPAVRMGPEGRAELALLQWGFVPAWAKDPGIGSKMINARGETAAEKPSFRAAFRRRRCLLPADGFFEWTGEAGHKQPYYCTTPEGPLLMGGIWEHWEGPEGEIETCAVLTTAANAPMRAVHDRMPVLIPASSGAAWLDPETPTAVAKALAAPYEGPMEVFPVTRAVGNPRFDDPRAVARIG